MTDSAMLGNLQLRVIWRAHELKNVSQACRQFVVPLEPARLVEKNEGVGLTGWRSIR